VHRAVDIRSRPSTRIQKALAPSSPLFTTIDQVLSSASNALLLFSLALVASVQTFGNVTLLLAIMWIFLSFNRGAIGNPLLLVSSMTHREIRVESSYGFTWSLGTGMVAGVAMLAVSTGIGDTAITIPIALALPVVLAQDILRYGAISQMRPRLAVFSDGVWCSIMLVTFIANTFHQIIPPLAVACIWGAGGLIGLAILSIGIGVRPRRERIAGWWRTYAPARVRFGSATSLSMVSVALVTAVIAGVLGSAAAGAFRGAASLFGPVSMIISAVPLIFIPGARVEARTARRQRKLLMQTAIITSLLTIAITGCLIWLPDIVGAKILGATWEPAKQLIPLIGLEAAGMCWMWSAYTFFQTLGRTKLLVGVRLCQTALQLGGVSAVAVTSHSILWVALTLAASTLAMATVANIIVTIVAAQSDKVRAATGRSSLQVDDAGRDVLPPNDGEPREAPWPEIDVLASDIARVGR
jgi:O-antigen/teichoic acid export membrane protein